MKTAALFSALKNNTIPVLHPIVLNMNTTVEDFIACLDSNLPFTKVHEIADRKIQRYPIGKLFNRHENILIPEEGRTMWHVKEASQATMFSGLANQGVVTGTFDEMKRRFNITSSILRQSAPDTAQNYQKAIFTYKGSITLDVKNIMGKTKVDGCNQILVGSYERYEDIMNQYQMNLFLTHNVKGLKTLLDEFTALAEKNDWHNQIVLLAQNIHKFPIKNLPPLYTANKLHLDTFTPEIQLSIIKSIKQLAIYSKKAYEYNIPEDNFFESDIQKLLNNAPY